MSSPIHRQLPPGRPIKRKRVSVACNPCRTQKIRCDGARPQCGTCQRRQERCIFAEGNNAPSSRDMRRASDILQNLARDPISANVFTDEQQNTEITAMGLGSYPLQEGHSPEEEFFGDSSAVAFIKKLQETIKPDVTPLGSEHLPARNLHLAPRFNSIQDISLDLLPPRDLSDHLVDCYFAKIHSLYPFVHKEAFFICYEALWKKRDPRLNQKSTNGLGLGDTAVSTTTFYYGLNIVFASGCQFSNIIQSQREATSEAFFQRCKQALDIDYLENGDLALTQTLLIMSHYLQGSRTPNRCWHVIGIACRLAQSLGLNTSFGDKHRSFAEIQMRRRAWHGCVMLDMAISCILGRSPIVSQESHVPLPEAIDDCFLKVDSPSCEQEPDVFSRVEWYVATLKMHKLLRKIQDALYNDTREHHSNLDSWTPAQPFRQFEYVMQIEAELEGFRVNIPEPIRWDGEAQEGPYKFLRERYLLRARFLYVKILAYRPILFQFLQQARQSSSPTGVRPSESHLFTNCTMNCSVLCAQSAIDLISLVHETCSTELASVWFWNIFYVFTAGLISLLAELHPHIVDTVTHQALQDAWEKCQATLLYHQSYNTVAERCARSLNAIRTSCLTAIEQNELHHISADDRQSFLNWGPGTPLQGVVESSFSEDLFRDLNFSFNQPIDPLWNDLDANNPLF